MGWASRHIEALQGGHTVDFRPRGNSMLPRIRSGQLVTVEPCFIEAISVGDVVLCTVSGRQYLHRVKAIGSRGFLICREDGRENGWTRKIFGRVIGVSD